VWQIVDSRAPAPLRRVSMPFVRRYADSVMFDGEALVPLHGGRERLRAPSFVYYPPVDTDAFVPADASDLRVELGIPAGAPVVGTVANVNPQKGLEYFVAAATQIALRRPDAWFVVVGAEYETHRDYSARLRSQVAAGRIGERFLFVGDRSDVERWYPLFDVSLITSVPRGEGTTTTAQEAMACAVPVVAADVAAIHEVVEDGVTGILVRPEDGDAFARAVLRLVEDDDLRRRMGEAGRARAVAHFGVEQCAEVHAAAYEAAFKHRRTGR
jgi:glycosyltransferase involved in cell wall biosynthesis